MTKEKKIEMAQKISAIISEYKPTFEELFRVLDTIKEVSNEQIIDIVIQRLAEKKDLPLL